MFHWYGLMVGLGIVLAFELVSRKLRAVNIKIYLDMVAGFTIMTGLIGARLYHVVTDWHIYQSLPWKHLFFIWQGGLGLIGGILGGILGLWLGLKLSQHEKHFTQIVDIIALYLPLAQAIGRWGNFFNQEIFGPPTNLPWGIYIEPANRPSVWQEHESFHPLFFYESCLLLVLFVLLRWLEQRKSFKLGRLGYLGCYLVGYGLIRWSLEFLRFETAKMGGFLDVLSTAQWVMLFAIVTGILLIYQNYNLSRKV